jgi:hypothetical protein
MTTTENINPFITHLKKYLDKDQEIIKWTYAENRYLSDLDKDFLSSILDYCDNDIDNLTDLILNDDPNGYIHEIADNNVDIYNYDLVKWVADDLNNAYIVNDAIKEYGADLNNFDLFKVIAIGQYKSYSDEINNLIYDITKEYYFFTDNEKDQDGNE